MPQKRYYILFTIFFAVFVLLAGRLFYFQIVSGAKLSKSASAQRVTNLEIDRPRGDILDKNLIPLTNRSRKFSIVVKPLYLRGNEDGLRRVCAMLGRDFNKLRREVEIKREPMIFETDEITKDLILSLGINGVSAINSLKRYDDKSVARHVLGYLNSIDQVGEAGIEKVFEDVLRYDKKNSVGVVTDARNNLVEGMGYRMFVRDGANKKLNVKLVLDYHIQKIAEEVMNKNGVNGAVVIEDVYNGDIVAMVSKPDYEQDRVERYLESPQNELFNRAVASYNLGSIFKVVVAALMLESDMNPNEEYYCPGFIKVGEIEMRCSSYEKGGHGVVDLKKAFAESCNPYFINAGIKLGYKDLVLKAQSFGLGKATGIKDQGIAEAAGNLPDPDSYYSNGDIANISIGQGTVMATPLQVADIVATIANGGIKNKVNLLDSIVDESGNKIRDLKVKRGSRVISTEVSDKLKQLMEEVIITGTGTQANVEEYGGAGGKTGSAETGDPDIVHAWFAGYFPRLSPRYSMSVFVENGQYGGRVAAPIFAEIAAEIMEKGY
jgi:penicillin-binding protein 2